MLLPLAGVFRHIIRRFYAYLFPGFISWSLHSFSLHFLSGDFIFCYSGCPDGSVLLITSTFPHLIRRLFVSQSVFRCEHCSAVFRFTFCPRTSFSAILVAQKLLLNQFRCAGFQILRFSFRLNVSSQFNSHGFRVPVGIAAFLFLFGHTLRLKCFVFLLSFRFSLQITLYPSIAGFLFR